MLSYGAARIPGRSAEEIHELVEWIRTSIRNEQRNHAIAQTQIWVNTPNATQLPTSPEVGLHIYLLLFQEGNQGGDHRKEYGLKKYISDK